jgi:ParB-like chromosome segregation protein Spo0J
MKIEKRKVAELKHDSGNTRSHGGVSLEAIKTSLEKFGQQKPIVITADGSVVAGNGTLSAAIELGWQKIGVVVTELEGDDLPAYSIADNRVAELAEWDYPTLKEAIGSLQDSDFELDSLGFSESELAPLLAESFEPPDVEAFGDEQIRLVRIALTPEQYETACKGIGKIKDDVDDETITDGRAIELLVADWLE